MVIGNAYGSLGLTGLLGKRDSFALRKGMASPSLWCIPSPPLFLPTGNHSSKNTHNPPIRSNLKGNGNNYHSSFPWNKQEKHSYALALQGTSQTLITSVSGTGNQYIHSQPHVRAVGESDREIWKKPSTFSSKMWMILSHSLLTSCRQVQ